MIRPGRPQRWLSLAAGLLFVAVGALFAWPGVYSWYWLREAEQALEISKPDVAISALRNVDWATPDRANVQYLLAVAMTVIQCLR